MNLLIVIILILSQSPVISQVYSSPGSTFNTSQYHFVPNASYFQFSISSTSLGKLSQQTSDLNFKNILGLSFSIVDPNYNIILFPSQDNLSLYYYNCYKRAAEEGIPSLMCPIPQNCSQPNISCQKCLQNALNKNTVFACFNCTSQNISLDLSFQQYVYDGTLVFILDNTPLLFNTGPNSILQLQISYLVEIRFIEDFGAFGLIVVIIFGVLLVIICIIAFYITCKIKRYEKQIDEYMKKKD